MNDLEKQMPEEAAEKLEVTSVKEESTTPGNEVVSEKESEDACKIDSSPALDIAEAADRIEEEEKKENKKEDSSEEKENKETTADKEGSKEPSKESYINYAEKTKEELIEALKNIIAEDKMESHKDVSVIKQCFYVLHNKEVASQLEKFVDEGNAPETFSAVPDESEIEMKELLSEFREKRNAYLEEKEQVKKNNLDEKNRVISELKALAEDIDNINLHFQKFQQLQQDFKNIGEVPAGAENDLWKSYQTAVEQFYDRLKMNKELRDLDFKKNYEVKSSLIEKAKELADYQDPVDAFRVLQTLHSQWRETGPVARDLREEMWTQFKEASTVVNKRHQDFFQSRKENEAANEAAKTALCEKAEAIDKENLKTFNDWDAATKDILGLQQEWKNLGFASKKMNNLLFARFRKACDEFFTAKAEHFKKTKEEFKENLLKKTELCEKAEALLEKATEKTAFDEMQQLQKEWRTVGVVRRKQGDEIWKRFCTAVDAFYDARKKLFSGKREEENENLAVKKEIIEALKAIPEDSERKEVIGEIRDLQEKWQSTGHVPFKVKDEINSEYRAQLDRLFGAFDLQDNRQRIQRYQKNVKNLEGDEGKINKEREKLLRAIENREAELKTIENNLGFFNVKSSAGNSMLKEFERKIQKLKEEISQIQEKISILDSNDKKPAEQ